MAEENNKEEKRAKFNLYTVIEDIISGKADETEAVGNFYQALGLVKRRNRKKEVIETTEVEEETK